MLKFKHYTVAVHDLDEAISDYEKRFGMEKVGRACLSRRPMRSVKLLTR